MSKNYNHKDKKQPKIDGFLRPQKNLSADMNPEHPKMGLFEQKEGGDKRPLNPVLNRVKGEEKVFE